MQLQPHAIIREVCSHQHVDPIDVAAFFVRFVQMHAVMASERAESPHLIVPPELEARNRRAGLLLDELEQWAYGPIAILQMSRKDFLARRQATTDPVGLANIDKTIRDVDRSEQTHRAVLTILQNARQSGDHAAEDMAVSFQPLPPDATTE